MGSQIGGIEGEATQPKTIHQEYQQRQEGTVVEKNHKLSRRRFLSKSALALGGLVVLKNVGNIAEYFSLLEKAEENSFTTGLPDEVPPVLRGIERPETNEYLRPPQQIIQEGLEIYRTWQKQNPNLPNPFWKKPDNYLDYARLSRFVVDMRGVNDGFSLPLKLASAIVAGFSKNDRPYNAFFAFTQSIIASAEDLIEADPGSGIMLKTTEKFKILKNNQNYDLLTAFRNQSFTKDDEELLEQEISHLIVNAVSFIQDRGKGKPVSTSLLLAYFLQQNQGDIKQSMWDTTIVLKMLARNNLQTFSFEPSRKGVELLNTLFIDEFSQQISLKWLVAHIPVDEKRLNDIGMTENLQYKNYQLPNKAGIFYHAWNIMALNTCMSPSLVRTIIRIRFAAVLFGGGAAADIRLEQGSQKIKDDLRIASSSAQVEQELWQYRIV